MMRAIDRCRLCGSRGLKTVLNLGDQVLGSHYVLSDKEKLKKWPLELVQCQFKCGLVQLRHSLPRAKIYGDRYGYRSGINETMRRHLMAITLLAQNLVILDDNDTIIDIGSNDGYLLNCYHERYNLIGIDPSANKFKEFYREDIKIIPKFFKKELVKSKAKIITSIAMFYDLDNPINFAKDIYNSLTEDGIWIFEVSNLGDMIKNNSYDTICHEHLAYYGIDQIKYILDKAKFELVNLSFNNINGGSICVVASKKKFYTINKFEENVKKNAQDLNKLIKKLIKQGNKIYGYGASTKGNIILQYCGLSSKEIPFISDRNPDKEGKFTPGTNIPIISEQKAREDHPDYFLVLPWHFKDEILHREKEYIKKGGKFIFPLPSIHIVGE